MQIRVVAGVMIAVAASSVNIPHVANAQSPMRESISVAMAIPQASSGLNAKVSLDLQGATLDQAIHAIARQADLKVTLGEDVFRASRKVTLHVTGLAAKDALQKVIAGTGISMSAVSSNQVVFVKEAANADGTIIGKVINAKTKQPMSGATVTLGEGNTGVVTGADGTFRLVVPSGEQTIHIRALGFVRQQKKVTVPDGQSMTIDVTLQPSASVLDEVVVTGTVIATERKAIATPITVITAEELEQRGITRIEQLFRGEVPGLYAQELGSASYSTSSVGQGVSASIYSRGTADINGGANPIKTYVDGVELLDPSYLGTLDPQSIERIEIVTGPQAATIYGSGAMGGVMQIFTKRGSQDGVSDITLSVRYGILQNNFSNGKTPAHNDMLRLNGGSGPSLSYTGTLTYNYTGQWQPKLYSGRIGASIGATHVKDRLTVSASLSSSATRRGTWKSGFTGSYGYLQLFSGPEFTYRGEGMATYFYSNRISTTSNQTVSLNADYRVTDQWQHHMTIGRSQNVMTLKPVAPEYAGTRQDVGSDTLFQTARNSGQRLTWNYNTSYVTSTSWLTSSLTLGANGSMGDQIAVTGGLASARSSTIIGWRADAAPRVTLPLNQKSWGAFTSWQIGLFSRLHTTFGLRAEQNPNYGRDVNFDFTPTNGLTYIIEYNDLSIKLMGSYGRATRPPEPDQRLERMYNSAGRDPSQYLGQLSNPDLRPEYSRGPQGGIELYYGNRGSLTVNHYSQKVTDLIQEIPVDSFQYVLLSNNMTYWSRQTQYRNSATVRQKGWEGTASVNAGPITLKGVYSWNDSRVTYYNPRDNNAYQGTGEVIPGIPTHTGNISVLYARGETQLSWVTNFVGRRILNFNYDRGYQERRLARITTYEALGRSSPLARWFNKPGYAKSDLSITHRLSPQLSLLANIVNVGNSFAADVDDFNPSLGRQTTLGFSYRFGPR